MGPFHLVPCSRIPETICYYQPTGAIDHFLMKRACSEAAFPAEVYMRGFFSFASPEEIDNTFAAVWKFAVHSEPKLLEL